VQRINGIGARLQWLLLAKASGIADVCTWMAAYEGCSWLQEGWNWLLRRTPRIFAGHKAYAVYTAPHHLRKNGLTFEQVTRMKARDDDKVLTKVKYQLF